MILLNIIIGRFMTFFAKKEEAKNEVKFLKEHSRIGKKYQNDFGISEQKVYSYNDWEFGL